MLSGDESVVVRPCARKVTSLCRGNCVSAVNKVCKVTVVRSCRGMCVMLYTRSNSMRSSLHSCHLLDVSFMASEAMLVINLFASSPLRIVGSGGTAESVKAPNLNASNAELVW